MKEKIKELQNEINKIDEDKIRFMSSFDFSGLTENAKESIGQILERDFFWMKKEKQSEIKGYLFGQSDYKKKVEDVIKKLKEDIKLNWEHYQYNYNPAGSEKRKKELLSKIDNLLKELEIN
jgi:hypothetical protein